MGITFFVIRKVDLNEAYDVVNWNLFVKCAMSDEFPIYLDSMDQTVYLYSVVHYLG